MNRKVTAAGLLLLIAILTACSTGIEHQAAFAPVPGISVASDDETGFLNEDMKHPEGKVTVWSYYAGAEWIVPIIQAEYPDLQIEVSSQPWDNYTNNYLTAVIEGNEPDVLFVDNNMLSTLVGLNVFVDLSAEPYSGEAIARRFNDPTIAPYRSITDNSLFALPLDVGPAVAYFRSDLFRDADLPAEPETLSRYLEDPSNWLTAAYKLKQQDAWIVSSEWDLIWMMDYTTGYFDRSLNFTRQSSAFVSAIELARIVRNDGLASGLDIISDVGREALNNGKIAMFSNGWWFRNELKSVAPNTSGDWRMMRLPLGLYGWAGSSGAAISATSRNKAGAWAVVNTLANHIANLLDSAESDKENGAGDPFFGGQKLQPLYTELVQNMPAFTVTPMDEKAGRLWRDLIGSALVNDVDPAEILANIEQLTMDSLQSEIGIIKTGQSPDEN